jgi:uncharacterized protein YukE
VGTATTVLDGWQRIDAWLSFSGSAAVDALLRPLVEPLAEPLDAVTGDAEEVRASAQVWRDAATGLRDAQDGQQEALRLAREHWSGVAFDTFERTAAEARDLCGDLAKAFDATAEFLDDAALEVETAEQLVETIIRELIEWAILTLLTALALSVATSGASVAAGAATTAAETAVAGSRIAAVLARVANVLEGVSGGLRALPAAKGVEGLLARSAVKNALFKPALAATTGLTASPLYASAGVLRDGALEVVADETDDRIAGETQPQTRIRQGLDEVVELPDESR